MADCSKNAAVYFIKNIVICFGTLKVCELGISSLFSHYQDTIVESEASPNFETLRAQPDLIEDQTYYGTVFYAVQSCRQPHKPVIFVLL